MDLSSTDVIAAFDVGSARIGVATARIPARLASPLTTLPNDDSVWGRIGSVLTAERVTRLVVGLPRDMKGNETPQTAVSRAFAKTLGEKTGLPVDLQDEAVTSKQAEAELKARGGRYNKEMVDALAATYILEDYLNEHGAKNG